MTEISNRNITSANATGVLVVDELFPNGITLAMFATDAALAADDETLAETRMGVDGRMVAGYIPSIKVLTLSLESVSPAARGIDTVAAAMRANMTVYGVTLVFTVPALRQTWTYSTGVLKSLKPTPDVKKVLDMRVFKLDFEGVTIEDY